MVRDRCRDDPERAGRLVDVEPGATVRIGHHCPAALRDQPGSRDVPGGHAAGLQERVEAAVRDIGEGQCGRSRVARRPHRPPDRAAARRDGAAPERQRDHAVRELVLGRGVNHAVTQHRGPVGGGPVGLAAHRVAHGAHGRTSVHHEAHRHAEVRDPVRVVDGPVERVHDPGPAGREGARHRRSGLVTRAGSLAPAARGAFPVVRPGLLGEDPVAWGTGRGSRP